MPTNSLTYPLTPKALRQTFVGLQPSAVHVTKAPKWHEAVVDGSWSLSRLLKEFRALGFKAVGDKEALLFVNEARTVGLQLFGVETHPTKNTWKTYYIEVQARPLSVARREQKQQERLQ